VHPEKKTIFLVSPFVPYPPARGVELRIARLLKWMHGEGYRVILVMPTDSVDDDALLELRKTAFAVHWLKPALRTRVGARLPALRRMLWEPLKRAHNAWRVARGPVTQSDSRTLVGDGMKSVFAPAKLIALVGKLSSRYRPTAVIAEYPFSAPVFSLLPAETLKIIDTIDVFSRKDEEVLSFGIADPLACSRDEEREYLLAADAIIAIQSRELRVLQEIVPERDVFLAGMDCDVSASSNTRDVIPDSIAIVASDNALNVHGLSTFLVECWPAVKDAVPSANLHVVGQVGAKCPTSDREVRYSGWVDDLDQVYRQASVVINPTIAGTGLKIKSVQALAHGKPLVAWTNGVEGLDYQGAAPYKECRSWGEFADAVILLLRSDEERLKLSERALSYAREEFGADKVYATLKSRLENHGSLDPQLGSSMTERERRTASAR
jgi:glycosyltransferase involved in cell wall biosynthesis